jgi:hypothetical protein
MIPAEYSAGSPSVEPEVKPEETTTCAWERLEAPIVEPEVRPEEARL